MELIKLDLVDKNGREHRLLVRPFQNDLGEIVILGIDILYRDTPNIRSCWECNTKIEVAAIIETEMANRGYVLEYNNRETWTDCEGYAIFKPQEEE